MKEWKHKSSLYIEKARRWFCKHVFKNPYYADHITMRELTDYLSLIAGFAINLFMSVFKFVFGILYGSAWLTSIAIYYFVLTGMRFMLLFREWLSARKQDQTEHRIYDVKSYRFCGVMMFALNWLLLGMGIPMIYQNPYREYPKILMIMFVAYAIYNFVVAIVNMVRFFKIDNPILTAARRVSLVTALVSVYALETAWIARYGEPAEFLLQQITKIITGSFVCFVIFSVASSMILQANLELGKLKKERNL